MRQNTIGDISSVKLLFDNFRTRSAVCWQWVLGTQWLAMASLFPGFTFSYFFSLSFWNFSGTQWLAFPGFHFLCFTFPTEDKVLPSSQKWNLHICFSAQENILQNLIIFRIIYKKNLIIFRKSKYFQSFNRKVVDYSENGTASWNISHFISFPKYLPFNSFDNIWLIIPILH